MRLIRNTDNFAKLSHPIVLTIGNFDGVHIAHQKILRELVEAAKKINAGSMVIIFEPTPKEFFRDTKAPARLTNLREKLLLFREMGVDYVWVLKFNEKLAHLSADEFIEKIILTHLNLVELMIGDDFKFGKNRSGDFALLEKYAKAHKFVLTKICEIAHKDTRISSTGIRQLLALSHFMAVEPLLGRPYTITGRVMHGAKRGRQWGFPTANIALKRKTVPLRGVYVVKVTVHSPHSSAIKLVFTGVANIGTRPTVDGTRTLLEVHLFDFQGDLYGQWVHVEFLHKIRDEQRFSSIELLKEQIEKDVRAAQQINLQRVV